MFISQFAYISDNIMTLNGEVILEENTENINDFLLKIYRNFQISYPKFYKMDELSKLAFLATELLLKDNSQASTSVVIGNNSSSILADLQHQNLINDPINPVASPAIFVYTLPNIMIGEICIRNNINGENALLLMKEFDAQQLSLYAKTLLDSELSERCIVGWVEARPDFYETFFCLIEPQPTQESIIFSKESLAQLYENCCSESFVLF
jgi:hypothetical protein